jgi:hypothetical protein
MTALVIRAIDQETAHASFAHLSESDFLRAGEGGHAPLKRGPNRQANHAKNWVGTDSTYCGSIQLSARDPRLQGAGLGDRESKLVALAGKDCRKNP